MMIPGVWKKVWMSPEWTEEDWLSTENIYFNLESPRLTIVPMQIDYTMSPCLLSPRFQALRPLSKITQLWLEFKFCLYPSQFLLITDVWYRRRPASTNQNSNFKTSSNPQDPPSSWAHLPDSREWWNCQFGSDCKAFIVSSIFIPSSRYFLLTWKWKQLTNWHWELIHPLDAFLVGILEQSNWLQCKSELSKLLYPKKLNMFCRQTHKDANTVCI